jgi:hypothetical protein|tara:strand:- start:567 stop:716 length:150 start_codon:yes stop_codon:yes gene_type:complete
MKIQGSKSNQYGKRMGKVTRITPNMQLKTTLNATALKHAEMMLRKGIKA